MIKYKQPGDILELTAPAGGVTSGVPVKIGQLLVIPIASAAAGAKFNGAIKGVFEMPVLGTDVCAEGDLLYWDDGNSRLTKTASGSLLVGAAVGPSANGVTVVDCRLNGSALADEA